ncbi:MAG TPA: aspartate:alanine exchanger family transporter [Candidatus Saccharimonadales bacterium]|nr:aspartate:alanine exchanger family transporter [Candidatus Saccharimonadales bacterium]
MSHLIQILAANPLLVLFSVVGLGYLVGSVRVLGFSLGVSAVLFVGLAFGALEPSVALPDYVYIIGLVLFVYAVGLQAGPGFFASFGQRGLKINLMSTLVLLGAAGAAVAVSRVLRLAGADVAGLFCGALTNTPALAATVETLKQLTAGQPGPQASAQLARPVVAYGLAYPFGVLGVILAFWIGSRVFRVDFAREEAERRKASGADAILSRTYRVTNPGMSGRTVREAMALLVEPGFVLSRVRHGEGLEVALPETRLAQGDQVVAVGTAEALERAQLLFGEESREHLPAPQAAGITYRRILVSNREVVGRTVAQAQLHRFHATITRLRRGDVDFVPAPDTVLELGDRIRVVAPTEELDRVSKYLGDSIRALSETDFLSMALGIVLGVLLGMIPLPLPNGVSFKLGFAGGPLIVALIAGRLERTGPITWGLPFEANLVLRQLGLVFFLAAIGTRAGQGLGATFAQGGWRILAAGAVVTTFAAVAGILVGYRYLKLPMSAVMGMVSGMQTQPACLAFAAQHSGNDMPNEWYASVYPASMIAKILLAQVLVTVLVRV